MSKRYKVCVIDEAADKQQCMEIETNGLPIEGLTALINGVLATVAKVFGAKPAGAPPAH